MRRREFITLLGGAAAAWPLAARAQQPAMPVVGYLHSGSLTGFAATVLWFRSGLKDQGYIEDYNVRIEYRWADGRYEKLPALAADLVSHRIAVLAAVGGSVSGLAAKGATSTVPVVFQGGGDPVKEGLVASLAQPGGNITGVSLFTNELAAKRLGLLHELVSTTSVIAVLTNPTNSNAEPQLREVRRAALVLKLSLHVLEVSSEQQFDAAFERAVRDGAGALLVNADPFFTAHREQLAGLSIRHALPTMYGLREHVEAGGLMSYAANLADVFHHVGDYVGQILKGAKPAELPVLQPTRFELVINLKTAKALGLTVPPELLTSADEVIE
jgi:putative ABC transport system substrate-binding protein